MADNISITAGSGTPVATDEIAGIHWPFVKHAFGPLDTATLVTATVGLPVAHVGALAVTGAFYQATQPVSLASTTITGSVAITGGLTDTQLRASAVPVSLASTTVTGSVAVTGPLTDTLLRASAVPVSLASTTVTGTVTITGGLTDTQLRASAVPVSGTVTINAIPAGANLIGDVNARQFVSSADVNMQSAAVAVGNGTVLPTTGYGVALIQITGTFVGTVTFEATEDGTNYVSISAVQLGTSNITANATVPGIYRLAVPALTNIRARISAYTSGSITALGRTSNAPAAGKVINLSSTSTVGLVAGAAVIGGVTQSGTWNIGTVTTLPALVAGAAIIGKVGIDQTTPGTTNLVSIGTNGTVAINAAIPTGANVIGALTANQSVNAAQINGVAPLMGTGISGTGALRVTLATDVALPTGANTIGTVNLAAPAATYSASISGLVVAALATDIFTITGSATKTVRITKITVSGVQTTAGQVVIATIKRSTADTAGTSTAPTKVPYDSASAAATAVVAAYTANPALGTTIGTITSARLFVPGAATASDAQGWIVIVGDVGQQYITLRGAAENIALNLNGVTVTGGAINVTVEWTES